jgi:hypothetical protein
VARLHGAQIELLPSAPGLKAKLSFAAPASQLQAGASGASNGVAS